MTLVPNGILPTTLATSSGTLKIPHLDETVKSFPPLLGVWVQALPVLTVFHDMPTCQHVYVVRYTSSSSKHNPTLKKAINVPLEVGNICLRKLLLLSENANGWSLIIADCIIPVFFWGWVRYAKIQKARNVVDDLSGPIVVKTDGSYLLCIVFMRALKWAAFDSSPKMCVLMWRSTSSKNLSRLSFAPEMSV